jgi:hypothetical protein
VPIKIRAERHYLRRVVDQDGDVIDVLVTNRRDCQAAGSGVEHHPHMHILPRWVGDSNFVSVVGETRFLPEELPTAYQRLRLNYKKSDAFLREFTVILVTGDKRQLA